MQDIENMKILNLTTVTFNIICIMWLLTRQVLGRMLIHALHVTDRNVPLPKPFA